MIIADSKLKLKWYKEAINEYDKSLQLAKNDTMLKYIYMGRAFSKQYIKDKYGAYADYDSAYNHCLKDQHVRQDLYLDVLINLSISAFDLGKKDEAFVYIGEVLNIEPNNFYGLLNFGHLLQKTNEYEKALLVYEDAIKVAPQEPYGYGGSALSKFILHDIKGATKDIETCLSLDTNYSYGYKVKAMIYFKTHNPKKACEFFNKSLQKGYSSQYDNEVAELLEKKCK